MGVENKLLVMLRLSIILHWQKSWENHEKKTKRCPRFSQNENIIVKMGE